MRNTKKISIALVFLILINLCIVVSTAYAKKFEASDWALPSYENAKDYKILPKYAETHNGTENLTREAATELIVKLYEALSGEKVKTTHPNPFTDTNNKEVLKAYTLGIISGISETKFQPDGIVNREEIVVLYFKLIKLLYPDYICNWNNVEKFLDDNEISYWAKEAIYSLRDLDLVMGYEDGFFRPKEEISLEGGVILSVRLYEFYKK